MGNFNDIIGTQVFLIVLMGIGVILAKITLVDKPGINTLSSLVLSLLLPCNILSSFFNVGGRDMLLSLGQMIFISALLSIAAYFLGRYVFFRSLPPEQKQVLHFSIFISNAAFLGNPVVESIYGLSGLAYASAFLLPMRIVMWTFGLALFIGKGDRKGTGGGIVKILLHPCLIATYAGMIILITGLRPGVFMSRLTFSLGNCTTPFSMIVVGLLLAQVKLKNVISKTVFYYAFLRLVLLPLALLGVLLLFKTDTLVMGVAVALTGMPAPTNASILANRYNADSELASKILLVSVVLSMLTIPAWVMLIRHIAPPIGA
ncbi:MAG: AEC family transporter [Treponema sp.]|jgi:predicted permease|nr:AEC family transporter [Treponema sp.]